MAIRWVFKFKQKKLSPHFSTALEKTWAQTEPQLMYPQHFVTSYPERDIAKSYPKKDCAISGFVVQHYVKQ